MYLKHSILEGLKILGFDNKAIKEASKEHKLEEIFLSNIFVNYLIILVLFTITVFSGDIKVSGKTLNMPVIFALLMVYPFAFNLVVYFVYTVYGLFAELVDKKKNIKPMLSAGFHASIVYTIIFAVIGLTTIINPYYALFLLICFSIYFIIAMFKIISVVYEFSHNKTFMVGIMPLLFIAILGLIIAVTYPELLSGTMSIFFK